MFSLIGTYAWTQEATNALLTLWGTDDVQKQLREARRNRFVFEKIAEALNAMGYNFTWKQCRTKIKNLCQVYRKTVRENVGKDGEPVCPYYKELNYIFNPSEAAVPPLFQTNLTADKQDEASNMRESVPMSRVSESATTHTDEQLLQDVAGELDQPHVSAHTSTQMPFEEEEDDDEAEEEEEDEEEGEDEGMSVGGVQQQWQSLPLMVVASPDGNLPQTVLYQPTLKARGLARVRQEGVTRQPDISKQRGLMGQQQQQQLGMPRKQGVVRRRGSSSQKMGVARMEPMVVHHQQQVVENKEATPRSSRLLKNQGHVNLKNQGGIITSVNLQQQPASMATMSTEMMVPTTARIYQEQNVSRLSDSGQDRQNSQRQGFSRKRSALDSEILELIERLHEEAEDREDTRQQRLLEHEKRMEEMRQQWEEERRVKEFQQQQQITQMFLQTLEKISRQHDTKEQQNNSDETEQDMSDK